MYLAYESVNSIGTIEISISRECLDFRPSGCRQRWVK